MKIGRVLTSPTRGFLTDIPLNPPDPLFGLTEKFKKDVSDKKVNLGIGAYRTDDNKPFLLPTVHKAEEAMWSEGLDHEYATIAGIVEYVKEAQKLLLGEKSTPIDEGRLAGVQTIGGTGALALGGRFLAQYAPTKAIYLPNPTWANHTPIFQLAGLETKQYRYLNRETMSVDIDGLLEDMHAAPAHSIFLLHACAHNPTGVDPTMEQWKQIADVVKENDHFAFFDCAYQGFASGDEETDAAAVRMFANDYDVDFAVAQSFSKNFGLYGERTGALSIAAKDTETKDKVLSQMKRIARGIWSNPPLHGARIVARILQDPELSKEWRAECKGMADRINSMRSALTKNLADCGSTLDWSHIERQIGMFCFSGLKPEQVTKMIDQYHIYLPQSGRISMAGVTSHNVGYLAEAMHAVTK
eukprot:CAMPEP_0113880680 /NCGR_PEP_ID=MMETSP0780_2-20120614/7926_1 /TAXON_ID=652834 /ORGANISM="Palpitomonas bilix" /LENGTH=412 /DNA_ID=CAMNT_0000867395 /DNA_START=55 /DNA_END=1293 /DNA_ORIENTATION=- /assembly_acc=CAM_ASM_000599